MKKVWQTEWRTDRSVLRAAWSQLKQADFLFPCYQSRCDWYIIPVGNRTMVAVAAIVNMTVVKNAQQYFFAFYHSYNLHNPPGMHLYFRLSFQDCPRASPALSHTMNNGKRKKNMAMTMVSSFCFSALTMVARVHDDGCISSGRYFYIHIANLLQTNTHIGCILVARCDT